MPGSSQKATVSRSAAGHTGCVVRSSAPPADCLDRAGPDGGVAVATPGADGAALPRFATAKPRVAYLVNQYPKVSHTFIRREILAVERQGFDVVRLSIRGWDGDLVDAEDVAERARTRYVLRDGILPVLAAALRMAVVRPRLFAGALAAAVRMSRQADRPLPYHVMYLAQACSILVWLEAEGVTHLHAHFGTNSAEVAMLVRQLGGPPYSFTVHGPDEFDKGVYLHLDDKIGGAKFVAAVNSYCRSQLFRRVGRRNWSKIKTIHCGLEAEFYAEPLREPAAEPRLVCVGRLCEQKGQLLLIEAFQHVAQTTDCQLVLAGDGEMRAEIEGSRDDLASGNLQAGRRCRR